MALVLTGRGTLSGTVTNVTTDITYRVDEQGVQSLIDTICDKKDEVSDCVVYGEAKASFDICSQTPISPYTRAILDIIIEGFANPCSTSAAGSPCSFGIAGSFAASLSAGFGAALSRPCSLAGEVAASISGQRAVSLCPAVFDEFRNGLEIYSTNMLRSVAEILTAVCNPDIPGGDGGLSDCVIPSVASFFREAIAANIGATLDAVSSILKEICYGTIDLSGSGLGCLGSELSGKGQALGNAATDFACFVVGEIVEAVTSGGSITICGTSCGYDSCNMAKGLIDNCDLVCYAFEKLIGESCFNNYIEQYLEENRCTLLPILMPNEATCADGIVIDWFAGALDRDKDKKCTIFNKFIEEDGTAEECITKRIAKWAGKDENPCALMEEIFGKIGEQEKAKSSGNCVNEQIVDYVDAQTNDLLYSIFTNDSRPSNYPSALTSGDKGYKRNLRNGILNFVQDETCSFLAAITKGLQSDPTLPDFTTAALNRDWYTFYFLGQGVTQDNCSREFDNFVEAIFCRVARKIVDRAEQASCPTGQNSDDCLIEAVRAIYSLIITNFGFPTNFVVNGECKESKCLVELKNEFVKDNGFCALPTTEDVQYIT